MKAFMPENSFLTGVLNSQIVSCFLQVRKGECEMKIEEICKQLKQEVYENGYQYGFCSAGKRYTPDFRSVFDVEYLTHQKLSIVFKIRQIP